MANKNILVGLTTTKGSDWRTKSEEIKKFGIKEIALFPTGLRLEERKELYVLLEKTGLEKIPHVHLRDDMEEWEMDFLVERYKTEVFNFHADEWGVKSLQYDKYLDRMYVENFTEIDRCFADCVKKCAGICLDVSHWEDYGVIQKNDGYESFKYFRKK